MQRGFHHGLLGPCPGLIPYTLDTLPFTLLGVGAPRGVLDADANLKHTGRLEAHASPGARLRRAAVRMSAAGAAWYT